MKRKGFVVLSSVLAVILQAVFAGIPVASDVEREFPNGARIVFFGDSITHHGHWSGAIADWLLTHYPERHYEFVNAGVAGDSAGNALLRVSEDVVPANPTLIISMFGMNDIGRHSYKGDKTTPEMVKQQQTSLSAYRKNISALRDELHRKCPQAKLQWLTPSPYDDRVLPEGQSHLGANRGLAKCAEIIREETARSGDAYIEVHAPMTDFVDGLWKSNAGFSLCGKDGIHPREDGGLFMAWCYLKAVKADPTVSDVVLNVRKLKVEKCVNARLSGLAARSGGIVFTLRENSLPMPVREGAERVADRIPFEELSRETLTVKGLGTGDWELKIDGGVVLHAKAEEFARGVELSRRETPQKRQAQEIAALNAKIRRVADLRQCYRALRHFKLRRELKGNVDDRASVAAFYETHRGDPGLRNDYFWQFAESYVKEWPVVEKKNAEIAVMLGKIEDLRIPMSHKYEIIPVVMQEKEDE